MADEPAGKATLKQRAREELIEFLVLAAYLYICLGALLLYKSTILQGVGVSFTVWGVAVVKALLLAKFMLLGRALRIAKGHENRPLIWPTLYRSFVFLVLLLVMTAIEETVVGYFQGRSFLESIDRVIGATLPQALASSLVMFLVLVPYFAFQCLSEVLGERRLVRLFLVDRNPIHPLP